MSVRQTAAVLTVVLTLLVPIIGCDSSPVAPDRSQWFVTYSVSITGNQSVVRTLSYRQDARTITVENPSDGWSTQFWTYAGTTVGMTAQGTVQNGTIEIRWRGIKHGGSERREVFGVDSCSAEETAQSCSLRIAEYTL